MTKALEIYYDIMVNTEKHFTAGILETFRRIATI